MIRHITASLEYLWEWETHPPLSRVGERMTDLMVKACGPRSLMWVGTSAFPNANSATFNQLLNLTELNFSCVV